MRAIEAYLAQHASAADTVQGIAQWWLADMGVEVPLLDVRLALDALVKMGRVECQILPEGTAIYRAASLRP